MSQAVIAHGPGNLVPFTEKRRFLASEAITKGLVVTLTGTTGYTVAICSSILMPVGVAAETAAAGEWFDVVVSGYCDNVTNNDDNILAYSMLFAADSGACDSIAYGADAGVEIGGIFGMSLGAITGTTCTNVIIFANPIF